MSSKTAAVTEHCNTLHIPLNCFAVVWAETMSLQQPVSARNQGLCPRFLLQLNPELPGPQLLDSRVTQSFRKSNRAILGL